MTLQEREEFVSKILGLLNGLTYYEARCILEEARLELPGKSVVSVQYDEPQSVLYVIRKNIDTIADKITEHLVKKLNQRYQGEKT